jgi:transcriptional regulator with XRE-family HTH domain
MEDILVKSRQIHAKPYSWPSSRRSRAPPPKKISRPPAKKRAPEQDPIAAAILKARMRAGLTQQQLADRLHTDQGNIARLERNRSQATVRTLKRVAEATGHELVINFRRFSKSTYKIARAHSDSAGCVARRLRQGRLPMESSIVNAGTKR